jgi:soluble lytic murein transglycosylase
MWNRYLSLSILSALLLNVASAATASTHTSARKPGTTASATKKTSAKTAHGKGAKSARNVKARKKISPARTRRVSRTFRATNDLRPMAQQLIEMRTPAAYAGVEAYAKKHAGTDAAALAYLAIGYSRLIDRDFAKSQVALTKAQARAGELVDYVRYFQAQALMGAGESEKAIAVFKEFQKNSQDSIFQRDSIAVYANALMSAGRTPEAVTYLEDNRLPVRADIELALGRAYLRSGSAQKGMEILRHLYFTMPLSTEATSAATDLQAQGSLLAGSYADRKSRAEMLAKAGRLSEAVAEYRALLADAPTEDLGNLQVALGVALRRTSNADEGRQLLMNAQAAGEANAQRLYQLGEMARTADDESAVVANLDRMRQEAAGSSWFEQALVSAGNMYLLKRNYDRAIDVYREASTRFPKGTRSSYSHWKVAWLSYRQQRVGDAKQGFEEHIQNYPASAEVPAALYWRARVAEQEGDVTMARAWYKKCSERFKNYYYGIIARDRLASLAATPAGGAPLHDTVLDRIPETGSLGESVEEIAPPEDDLRYEKSRLLVNAGMTDFAVRELQAADGGKGANWATLQIASIYRESGQYHRALQFLKRAVPNYYSVEISQLPKQYWDYLFPTPYWGDVRRFSKDNGLDPYLVASLIRQESEFNPSAVSHANAWGLMQLLPTVGRGEARALRVRGFSTDSLLKPTTNIQLGTHYFKAMVDQFHGQVEYALAAYNAGSNRVDDWMQIGKYGDIQEFVESIPFTETREYVQAIVRNAQVYKKLYPSGSESEVAETPASRPAKPAPKPAKGKVARAGE